TDTKTRSLKPGTACQIEFRLIQLIPGVGPPKGRVGSPAYCPSRNHFRKLNAIPGPVSPFCPASLLGFSGRSLPRSPGLLNSKVFKLCASFQFLSQPDGLRSSPCLRVARSITVLDRHSSTFQ